MMTTVALHSSSCSSNQENNLLTVDAAAGDVIDLDKIYKQIVDFIARLSP